MKRRSFIAAIFAVPFVGAAQAKAPFKLEVLGHVARGNGRGELADAVDAMLRTARWHDPELIRAAAFRRSDIRRVG